MAVDWPTVSERPLATGARHEPTAAQLFFSTTDDRGVITDANSVFVEMSRHPRSELIGAPHSIIRHQDMPGGAFKLMWDALQAGEPFCAYVDNLAGDGSTYTVFATVTPIDGGYLSVRARPMREDLLATARSLYRLARPHELSARASGSSARRAAQIGRDQLATGLRDAGLASYDDFVALALPAEVEARAAAGVAISERPGAAGPLGAILNSARAIEAELGHLGEHQRELAELAEAVVRAEDQLDQQMSEARSAADRFATAGAGNVRLAPVLLTVTVWAEMMAEISRVVRALADELEQFRSSCSAARFKIALSMLHDQTVGQFAVELSDRPGDQVREAAHSIDMLCLVLHHGFAATAAATSANAATAMATVDHLHTARDLMAMPHDLMAQWKVQVAGRDEPVVTQLLPEVDEQLRRTEESLQLLTDLADRCAAMAVPLDTTVIETHLAAILRANRELTHAV